MPPAPPTAVEEEALVAGVAAAENGRGTHREW